MLSLEPPFNSHNRSTPVDLRGRNMRARYVFTCYKNSL